MSSTSSIPPLDRLDEVLAPTVRAVVARDPPIPTLAGRAAEVAKGAPGFVRGDIGQVVGVDPPGEVLYGPPVGLDEVRAALAALFGRTFGVEGLTAAHVALCTGGSEALALLFQCFGGPGRSVGLPRGYWENYLNGIEVSGGRPVVVDFFDRATGALDGEGLERAIRAEGLSALVANFPCNPTGAVLDAAEAARLAQVAERTGVVLIADEVYARLRYDGLPPLSLVRFAPGHAVSIGSASKEYLLPGARMGWMVSARPRMTDHVLRRVIRGNTASPSVLAQQRLLPLVRQDLEGGGRMDGLRHELKARRDALLAVLARHEMRPVGRAGRDPQGTIFLVASLPPWWPADRPDQEFCERAIEGGWFSSIPGSAFGLDEPCARFAFGSMPLPAVGRLDAALSAMRRAVAAGG